MPYKLLYIINTKFYFIYLLSDPILIESGGQARTQVGKWAGQQAGIFKVSLVLGEIEGRDRDTER
jgi:hypothetical protein